MLNSIDYGIIIIYFLIIVGVGVFSIKFTKNKEDFLVAGRRLPFFMYFGCMCALAIGGAATIGSSKWGYKVGISGIWLNGSYRNRNNSIRYSRYIETFKNESSKYKSGFWC